MDIQSLVPEVIQDRSPDGVQPIAAADLARTFENESIDLLAKGLGTRILSFSDEFFAPAAALIEPKPPIHKPNTFTEQGAWYDGWETRRHNAQAFDYVVFRLGVASGRVGGVEIDTGFFSGNHAPEVGVEGVFLHSGDDAADDRAVTDSSFDGWTTILPRQPCGPAMRQGWKLADLSPAFSHIRLLMYPDGGISRFRLYGQAVPVWPADASAEIDLASMANGGVATRCSDQHFGKKDNLLLPGRGVDMGDGWETKRTRGVHVDWVIIRLGAPGSINRVVVDTAHFKGNFPQKVQAFAASTSDEPDPDDHDAWVEIVSPQPCGPHKEHEFAGDLLANTSGATWTFVKMVIIPDGGVKRLRVYGRRTV